MSLLRVKTPVMLAAIITFILVMPIVFNQKYLYTYMYMYMDITNATVTADDPVRLCDKECWRFRQHFNRWPQDKPKAVIYYLSNRYFRLKKSLHLLDINFNRQFQYPVVIFHERYFRPVLEDIAKLAPSVYFQEVTFTLPSFLEHPVIQNSSCPLRKIGYRHMCRFQAKLIYQEPIMEGLDYYWRLDDDSYINEPIKYEVFQFMLDNNMAYGYRVISNDFPLCTIDLWKSVQEYIDQKHMKTQFFDKWPPNQMYYNNFEISSMALWRSPEYRDYIDYIDKLGGIYYHRWGDAPIKSIAVSLFVPRNRTHQFKDVSYRHQEYNGLLNHTLWYTATSSCSNLCEKTRAVWGSVLCFLLIYH